MIDWFLIISSMLGACFNSSKKKSSNDTVIVFQESKFRETGVITPQEVRKTCFFLICFT